MEKDVSKRIIALIIIVAIGAGISYAGGDGSSVYAGIPVFVICGALAFTVNWLAFVPANVAQTEKYYDLIGSLTYLIMIGTAVMLSPELGSRGKIAAMMVVVWALRLGTFLFRRINQDGHDDRFDDIKINPFRFFIAWSIQALWALLTAACALAIITSNEQKSMELIGYIGLLIWIIGFLIEIVADAQKRAFKRDVKNKGGFITTGLWSWSRHPNYFGEIILWIGMAVLALPVLNGLQWFTLVSPLFVAFLLTKVSGIPMLAKKGHERWGDEPLYKAYLEKTSLLIPMPPKSR
jgi:steroid 5-alpha reductase family enzyme